MASIHAQVPINDFRPFKYQLEASFSPINAAELGQEMVKVIEAQAGITEVDFT